MIGKITRIECVRNNSIYEMTAIIRGKIDYYQSKGLIVEIQYSSFYKGYEEIYSALLICKEKI